MPRTARGTTFGNAAPMLAARPLIHLLGACLLVVAVAVVCEGHSLESVDVRTYVEMARGVELHGLPYLDNGPATEYAPLRVRWNVPAAGHLWGVYGPAYAYFGAPFLAMGGLRMLTAATCLLVIPILILTFLLARRVVEDERYALLAAAAVAFGTPLLAKSLETTAYPLATLCGMGATYATVVAIEARSGRRYLLAAIAGAVSAIGTAAHLLILPMIAAILVTLAMGDAVDSDRRSGLRSFLPTREKLMSAGFALASFAVCSLPVCALNRVRFGSYNPWTYGPTPWRGSTANALASQNIGAHLRYAAPCIAFAVALLGGWLVTNTLRRRRTAAKLAVLAVAATVVCSIGELREKLWRYGVTAFAFVIDQSVLDLAWPYERAPEGFAWLFSARMTKSMLQSTPLIAHVLAIGLVLPKLSMAARHRVVAVLAPAAALFASWLLRANLGLEDALGFPAIHIRYTIPALPLLVVGATVVVRDIAPTRRTALVPAIFGATVGVVLCTGIWDGMLRQQVLALAVPVVAAGAAVTAVFLRHPAISRWFVALTCALSFAVSLGHDLRSVVRFKVALNERVGRIASSLPERFAIVGDLPALDPVLALRTERDIEYVDLWEAADPASLRRVYEHWQADERPVFFLAPWQPIMSPWPDATLELLEEQEWLYRAVPIAPSPEPSAQETASSG